VGLGRTWAQHQGYAEAAGVERTSELPQGPGLPIPREGGTHSVVGQRQDQRAEAGGTSGLHLVQPPGLVAQDCVHMGFSSYKHPR